MHQWRRCKRFQTAPHPLCLSLSRLSFRQGWAAPALQVFPLPFCPHTRPLLLWAKSQQATPYLPAELHSYQGYKERSAVGGKRCPLHTHTPASLRHLLKFCQWKLLQQQVRMHGSGGRAIEPAREGVHLSAKRYLRVLPGLGQCRLSVGIVLGKAFQASKRPWGGGTQAAGGQKRS